MSLLRFLNLHRRLIYIICLSLCITCIATEETQVPMETTTTTDANMTTIPTENTSPSKEDVHIIDSLEMLIFISLLVLNVLTIWLFKHRRLRFVHETGLAIIYGLIVGAIIRYTSKMTQNDSGDGQLDSKATFNPEIFFNVLLPPIIFNAGYSMKRKHFFKNFGAIMTYAFLGTVVSCFVVGAILYGVTRLLPSLEMGFNHCILFGAIVSATDPVTILAIFSDLNVDVDMYALVFGESVLNDAVAIVLAGAVSKYSISSVSVGFDGMALLMSIWGFLVVFFGAFALGSAIACLNALLTKYTRICEYPLLETSLFFLMSYGTFLAAEAAGMTGIVAVLFCGICQAHYTLNNLSEDSKSRTKQLFEFLNFLMENFVFIYIGVSTFTFTHHRWNAGFIIAAFVAVIVGRLCNIYPLSFLLNLGRSNKIRYNFQHFMMFSGLRGAIAFALAIRHTDTPQQQLQFTTILLIVEVTVIFCSGLTTPMLQWLKIRVDVDDDTELQDFHMVRSSPNEPPPMESSPGRLADKAKLVKVWYNIDSNFVKPFLTHAWPPLTETLPQCCLPLARLLTTKQQMENYMRHRSAVNQNRSDNLDTDMIVDGQDAASTSGDTDPGPIPSISNRSTDPQQSRWRGDSVHSTRIKLGSVRGEHV